MSAKKITVKLIKGLTGRTEPVRANIRGLGLRKTGDVVTLENTPSVRGMIKKVIYLLEVKE